MKDLQDICNVNIPNSLHSLLEASLLADIEDTLDYGDRKIIKLEKINTIDNVFGSIENKQLINIY